ncbi:MAG: alpha/beta fold hydrolase [Planctomycetota bacterium]
MPTVDIEGTKIQYGIRGDGPPLVMIMGLAISAQGWFSQVPEFQKRFRCILFDNRGTGDSDKPDSTYTTRIMANDVLGLLDALRISRAHIIGFSLGGLVAQEFVLTYPQKVGKLILSNTFSKLNSFGRRLLGTWKHSVEKGEFSLFLRDLLAWLFTPEYIKHHARDLAAFKLAIQGKPHLAAALIRQIEAIERHDTSKRLGRIRSPTLVLSAACDRMVPPSRSEELTARIPNATLEILPRGGHAAFIEEPELYNAAVLSFLNGEDL